MEQIVVGLEEKGNIGEYLNKAMKLDFSKEMSLKVFIDKYIENEGLDIESFKVLHLLFRENIIYLKYNLSLNCNVIVKSPFLFKTISSMELQESFKQSSTCFLSSHSVLYNSEDKTIILNAHSNSSVLFNFDLVELINEIQRNAYLKKILFECELFSPDKCKKNNEKLILNDVFHYFSNANENMSSNAVGVHEMLSVSPPIFSNVILNKIRIDELDFNKAILNRSTRYVASKYLNLENIINLIELVYATNIRGNHVFPSAGGLYQIFPLVNIYDNSLGLESGVYVYNFKRAQLELMPEMKFKKTSFDNKARCSISLVTNSKVSNYKYENLSYKLDLINSGVILSYFYLMAEALKLNLSANGTRLLATNEMKFGLKELAGINFY